MADEFNIKTLHHAMWRSLELDELRTICQYLSVNPQCKGLLYSDLEGIGITGKSLSLIDYCEKKRTLTALINTINDDWPVALNGKYEQWRDWAAAKDRGAAEPVESAEPAGQKNHVEAPQPSQHLTVQPTVRSTKRKEQRITALLAQLDNEWPSEEVRVFGASLAFNVAGSPWVGPIATGEKILKLDEGNQIARVRTAAAYVRRGADYQHSGKMAQAIADYDRAIQIDPSNVDAYWGRGITFRDMGNKALAQRDLQRAAELGSDEAQAELEKL